jgi:hypothetical protein
MESDKKNIMIVLQREFPELYRNLMDDVFTSTQLYHKKVQLTLTERRNAAKA